MIEVIQLSKRFGARLAVDRLSFNVGPGEVLGFLGPNGAGKSTTMKMVTGFLRPTEGSARINGLDILEHPLEAKREFGYLPEGAPGYGDMSVLQFLGFIAELRGLRGAERDRRLKDVIDQVHLHAVLAQKIDTLSKGFRRRVGLAQAIMHDPKVLILDEPTDGLDPNQKHEVRNLIRGMSKDKIIVISTHILEEVEAVCSRALIIAKGRLLADGTPDELAARSPYHGALTLELEKPVDAEKQLGGIAGLERIERDAEGVMTLIPQAGADLLAAVSHRVQEQGWSVRRLVQQRGRLDEVFRDITGGAQA